MFSWTFCDHCCTVFRRYEKHFIPNVALQQQSDVQSEYSKDQYEGKEEGNSSTDKSEGEFSTIHYFTSTTRCIPIPSHQIDPSRFNHLLVPSYTVTSVSSISHLNSLPHQPISPSHLFIPFSDADSKQMVGRQLQVMDCVYQMESLFMKVLDTSPVDSDERQIWHEKYTSYSDSIRKCVMSPTFGS